MRRRKQRKRRIANIKHHAKVRGDERFGGFTAKDFREMVEMIQYQHCTFVKKTSNRVSVYRLEYKGNTLKAAYDKKRKLIITVFK